MRASTHPIRRSAFNLSTFAYLNDALGRRVEVTRSGLAFGALAGATDAYGYNARSEVVSARRTLGGGVVRGEADAGAVVTVNENPTWRKGEYFYGGDYADNAALPVFKEVEIAAVVPATSPDGWDEMSAVTGRVFVAQTPETFEYDADGNMLTDGRFIGACRRFDSQPAIC